MLCHHEITSAYIWLITAVPLNACLFVILMQHRTLKKLETAIHVHQRHIFCSRYISANRNLSAKCRKYAKDVPECLHERPHDFVRHIMGRLQAARDLASGRESTLHNSDGETCTCEDHARHTYPCKHMLSKWISADGSLAIPSLAMDPWITLDNYIGEIQDTEDTQNTTSTVSGAASADDSVRDEVETPKVILSPPKVMSATDDISAKLVILRKQLDKIKSWTYMTSSLDSVDTVLQHLNVIEACIKSDSVTGKLTLSPKHSTKTAKKRLRNRPGVLKRAKRKVHYGSSGRVGLKEEFTVTNISDCGPPPPKRSMTSTLSRGKEILKAAKQKLNLTPR